MSKKLEELKPLYKFYQENPGEFFKRVLGVTTLESYQEKLLYDIAHYDRVAVRACHDVGKSWTFARAVLWFGACFPNSKIITTAPTYNQVKNILWSEINAAFSQSKEPLGGVMNMTEWRLGPEWYALGFTARNEANAGQGQGTQSSFQGFHAPFVLVVFDEATGIPPAIWKMAEGLLTSAHVKFLAIGNPTSKQCDFYRCFNSAKWRKVKINCFDSPNLIANGLTDMRALQEEIHVLRGLDDAERLERLSSYKVTRPYLLSAKWVCESILDWGFEHPLTQGKILGEFPTEDDKTLFPLHILENAMLNFYTPTGEDKKVIGVDIARFGSDFSCLTAIHGKKFLAKKRLSKVDLTVCTGEVMAMYREHGADVICLDETGLGSGVVDRLKELQREHHIGRDVEIRGVNFGSANTDEKDAARYVNVKARMYGLLAEDLKSGFQLPGPPHSDSYLDEMPMLLYSFDSKGRMMIESKDDFKKRTGRKSPDDTDSLALANYGRYHTVKVGKMSADAFRSTSRPFASGTKAGSLW